MKTLISGIGWSIGLVGRILVEIGVLALIALAVFGLTDTEV